MDNLADSEIVEKVLVVDDFCDEIEQVITSAHAAGFSTWLPKKGKVGSSVYEGMGFWGHHALMLRSLIGATGRVIVPNSMFFRATNESTEQAYIHSDRSTGAYTCVAYLSQHDDEYGTAFYRHIPTGLVEMPSFEEMEDQGIAEELQQDMVSRDESKWEMIDFVEGKYNRAVIFTAPLFHSRIPLNGFGKDEQSARLVWVSHYYKLAGSGELF